MNGQNVIWKTVSCYTMSYKSGRRVPIKVMILPFYASKDKININ